MKIFVAHSSNFDFNNKLYIPIRNSELNNLHTFLFPQENNKQEIITKDIIKSCDLVIVEISYPSTGAGIEMGWANAFNVPIICIYEKGNKFSSAINYVADEIIEYSHPQDFLSRLSVILSK